ncbi:DNA topoisomerase III [Xenorhabdus stockiae]|uniref:DNA topoisomerase III n=1 Tax=Xenorhabdus stockiae TaxID=351614 RepID=A0A2D0KL58_9GAMM|nr:DNA topoisomerase III [Xenorhabdus stockiae]
MTTLEKDTIRFQAKWLPATEEGDDENRCTREAVAQAVQQRCQQATQATVMAVSKKREKTLPPLCFDLIWEHYSRRRPVSGGWVPVRC